MSKASQRVCQQKAVQKYKEKHYDIICLHVKKGDREAIKDAASSCEMSANGFICSAIETAMKKMGRILPSTLASGEAVQSADASATSEPINGATAEPVQDNAAQE